MSHMVVAGCDRGHCTKVRIGWTRLCMSCVMSEQSSAMSGPRPVMSCMTGNWSCITDYVNG